MPLSKNCIPYLGVEQPSQRHKYFREYFAAKSLPEGGFIVHDERFHRILGENPTITVILEQKTPLEHEAGVYIPGTGEAFATSNFLVENGKKDIQI
ncbi:hypothetical protein P154DRAFT_521011 [Amniculicola lignicola CBS 123094]|uniref:Uncharacterized protein n=1 Tax=Amniculicola lignicola CBS 123094 TaxID=1392246 RepID=A0A6A5WKZ7_9PLEO|nr:hypothetical protein P154DRAFT_521011 [Amniculicola lignicola CBS 123094]